MYRVDFNEPIKQNIASDQIVAKFGDAFRGITFRRRIVILDGGGAECVMELIKRVQMSELCLLVVLCLAKESSNR